MSRMEALKSSTLNGAYAAFEEGTRGSLKAGKLADIVVLSKDITRGAEEENPTAHVAYTIVGGKVGARNPSGSAVPSGGRRHRCSHRRLRRCPDRRGPTAGAEHDGDRGRRSDCRRGGTVR